MVKVTSFLFGRPKPWADYAFVVVRLAIGVIWINADIPRWTALTAGKPLSNNLVSTLFGPSMVPSLTLFFTILETLGAIAYILGFATRLAAVWGVVEFAITGTNGLLRGSLGDYSLMAGSLVLLLHGSFRLSLDGLIAKKKT
ncbi:MAG: DoxX family protein [Candidatus Bathyarchaeia archaeon]